MKVWVLAPNENWICDRIVKEFYQFNSDITVTDQTKADIIWLYADWCWKQVPKNLLLSKKVVTTIHHIVPEKFNDQSKFDFSERDKITTVYHVYNQRTFDFIKNFTNKPIYLIKYWCNQYHFNRSSEPLADIKNRFNLPTNKFIVFSAQRDTEGSGISSGIFRPKLEKGPDLFCDFVSTLKKDVHVLLAGWRRQYIIQRLKKEGINFTYIELPNDRTLIDMYSCADLYPVSARYEGGPQALLECGLLNIPVVSRPVGIAEQVLPSFSINENLEFAKPEIPNVQAMKIPQGFFAYRDFLSTL